MVPTQDFALLTQFAAPIRADAPLDLLPAAVVALVVLAMAVSLVLVALRRRDAE